VDIAAAEWNLSGLYLPTLALFLRQRSEQYLTSSQTFSHFFRQVNGRWQTGQSLVGRSDFFMKITKF